MFYFLCFLCIICARSIINPVQYGMGFPGGSAVKNPPADAGDSGSIPGLGRSPGEGNDNQLPNSCWEIPWTEEPGGLQFMGPQKSQTQLRN